MIAWATLTLTFALAVEPQRAQSTSSGGSTPVPPTAPPADSDLLRHGNGRVPPRLSAVRAVAGAPRIDGRLDDPIWALAEPTSDFRQRAPSDGDPPSERTEVRIAYDDEALYVAARMFDSDPARIVARLGRRDNLAGSDYFEVDIDSYHDHRTCFLFAVNPLGVRRDAAASYDFGFGDEGWDAVWEAATQRDSIGWTAEIRIPLSQLRFPNAPGQVWGINFFRYLQRKGETSVWAYSAQTDMGYASFFGHLLGLANLPQPRRLEVLPYAAGIEQRLAAGSPGNPFDDGSREIGRVGLDLKYGLTSNLTLSATVNPDFGQVEADPAVVNLTAYETFFSERRPFFVEGAGIFRAISPGNIPVNGPQFLYSRRIGRAPQGSAVWRGAGSFTDTPTSTTILGAAKLSGRTAGGWSLGVMEAVTAREYARVGDSTGVRFRDEVEPPTNYAVLRAMRDFGAGATTVGITGTAVNRGIDDPRLAFLRTAAYAGGVDFGHRIARNRYSVFAALGFSYIQGDTAAIQAAQLSSARYYQRPDARHVTYDRARTSLAGWTGALGFAKDQGTTVFSVGLQAYSPGFEINDLGFQTRVDRASLMLNVSRRWTRPGRVFRSSWLGVSGNVGSNFGGDRTTSLVSASGWGELLNYWSLDAGLQRSFRVVNDALLRGGPAGVGPAAWWGFVGFSSDYRRRVSGGAEFQFSRNALNGWGNSIYAWVTFQPSPPISLSVGPSYSTSLGTQQYVASQADTTARATYDRRYVFAEIRQHALDLTTRLNITFAPPLSLQLYAQPFVATGDYRRFMELRAPRTTDYIVYGETPGSTLTPVAGAAGGVTRYVLDPDGPGPRPAIQLGNPDFSSRSLRGNAVLRWEYRSGSTLFLVWTTSCSAFGPHPTFDAAADLRHLCQGRGDNVFAVKVNYWLSL